MKYLITLSLIVLSLSQNSYDQFVINMKQKLSKQVVDLPPNIERLIKDLRGYTNVFKTTINYNQLRNYLTGKGFTIDVYASCLEATFNSDSYIEKRDYFLAAYKQYSLNQYISSCHKVGNNSMFLIAIRGRYSGTIQTIIEKKQECTQIYGRLICPQGVFVDTPRELNLPEWGLVNDTLKIKYYKDALDQLNSLN